MSFLSGKSGKVRWGTSYGTTLKVKKWQIVPKCQILDVTNSESAGFGEYIAGIKDGDCNIDADYDYGTAPYSTGSPGDIVPVKLYLNDTTGAFWVGNVIIEEMPNAAETRGTVSLSIKGKFTGGLSAPSGS